MVGPAFRTTHGLRDSYVSSVPLLARERVRQAILRAPFLAPSLGSGGKQCCPKEGCFVTQGAAEFQCCLDSLKSDHIA